MRNAKSVGVLYDSERKRERERGREGEKERCTPLSYQVSKEYRLFKFCYVPATSATSSKALWAFLAAANNCSQKQY
jgi:hypothetical protein